MKTNSSFGRLGGEVILLLSASSLFQSLAWATPPTPPIELSKTVESLEVYCGEEQMDALGILSVELSSSYLVHERNVGMIPLGSGGAAGSSRSVEGALTMVVAASPPAGLDAALEDYPVIIERIEVRALDEHESDVYSVHDYRFWALGPEGILSGITQEEAEKLWGHQDEGEAVLDDGLPLVEEELAELVPMEEGSQRSRGIMPSEILGDEAEQR